MAHFFRRSIDFMGVRNWAFGFSALVVVASLGVLAVRGLNYGLDFSGGTVIELQFAAPVSAEQVRRELETCGFHNGVVQTFGTDSDLLIRLPPQNRAAQAALAKGPCRIAPASGADATAPAAGAPGADGSAQAPGVHREEDLGKIVAARLRGVEHVPFTLERSEFVGPAVGAELKEQGGLAMLAAIALVLIYVLFRFTFKLAVGAVVALLHDPIITLGAFALFQWDFDLSVLAAVLAVMGYSINDSIVVADRVRENFRLMRRETPVEVVNISINQTLDRTIMTSVMTLLTMLALLVFGGEMTRNFAIAMVIGIVVGTYSSIYISATLALIIGLNRNDLMIVPKENAADGRP